MYYQYHPYIWTVMASAALSVILGTFILLKCRNVKGAKSFLACLVFTALWSIGNAMEIAGADLPTKLFWANIQYFAYCYLPVALLSLCLEFSDFDHWVNSKKVLWFALLPSIIVILAWTDQYHGLIRYDIRLDYSGIFPVIVKKYGLLFYLHALYSYLISFFSWLLLFRGVFFRTSIYRKQTAALLVGIGMVVVPNILYISGRSPVQDFDLTPVFFIPAGLVIAWAIFRYKMIDVIPLAWATVIKTMDAGVMVLDLRNRVLDVNPAFAGIAGVSIDEVYSEPLEEVCAGLPELIRFCMDPAVIPSEFTRNVDGQTRVYEVWLYPITDKRKNTMGRLVVVNDITQRRQIQRESQEQQWKLAITEERERMARDLHDNLAQVLGFINYQAAGIRFEMLNAGVETAADELEKLTKVTQSAYDDIREYIRLARESAKIDRNLVATLRREIENFELHIGIRVETDITPGFTGQELKPQVRMNLVYIFKEALNNIAKHAGACKVRLSLNVEGDRLQAVVEDDGRGFDAQKMSENLKCGFGLNIMRERAWEIGAQFEIESAEGKGCRITLQAPIGEREV